VTRRLASIPAHTHHAAAAPKLLPRSDEWFTAAAAGRDAQREGQPISGNPFVANRPDWRAWRIGWVAASRGEDVTTRYSLLEDPRRGRVTDYNAEALADFRAYAADESIAPDLREAAREILSLVEINARVGAMYGTQSAREQPDRRTNEQIERAIAAAIARYPDGTRNKIASVASANDKRVRNSPTWIKHIAARDGQEVN